MQFNVVSMKRHGRQETIVTDRLRCYGAAITDLGRGDDHEMGRGFNNWPDNSHLPSDNESGRCYDSGVYERYRSSPLSMPRSTTTFQRNATSKTAP